MRQPPTDENTLSGWSESQSCLAIGNATSLPKHQLTKCDCATHQVVTLWNSFKKKRPLQHLSSVFHIVGKAFIDENTHTHKQCYLCFPFITINGWSTCKISWDQDIKLHKPYITNINLWFFNIKLPNIFLWFLLDPPPQAAWRHGLGRKPQTWHPVNGSLTIPYFLVNKRESGIQSFGSSRFM